MDFAVVTADVVRDGGFWADVPVPLRTRETALVTATVLWATCEAAPATAPVVCRRRPTVPLAACPAAPLAE